MGVLALNRLFWSVFLARAVVGPSHRTPAGAHRFRGVRPSHGQPQQQPDERSAHGLS